MATSAERDVARAVLTMVLKPGGSIPAPVYRSLMKKRGVNVVVADEALGDLAALSEVTKCHNSCIHRPLPVE